MIQWVLDDEVMPPWFANHDSGPWANDASLSDDQRSQLYRWLRGGTPAGDPQHAPLAKNWVEGWSIGEPDLVVPMSRPFEVPADGVVDYQYIYAETGLKEDRWVRAVEIRPTAKQVMHHVLVFLADSDDAGNGLEGFFAGTVPGQSGIVFPEGTGKLLPAGSRLLFQLHYTPNGEKAVDQSEIGFIFADEPPRGAIITDSAYSTDFAIPPGAFDHEVRAEMRFPRAATLLSFFPHTHLRGIAFAYELTYPDGEVEQLLSLPNYDFNWQLNYDLAQPKQVPAGTVMSATAWYDNSSENPANPDPEKWVRYGEQTFDEMMIGYVNWVPTEELAK